MVLSLTILGKNRIVRSVRSESSAKGKPMISDDASSVLFSFYQHVNSIRIGERYKPRTKLPPDAKEYGTANSYVRRNYQFRNFQRHKFSQLLVAHGKALSLLNEREVGTTSVGQAVQAYMNAAADPTYVALVQKIVELEKEMHLLLPFKLLAEAAYQAEVRAQFPEIGGNEFDIDANWMVFRKPDQDGFEDLGQWMDDIETAFAS